MHDGATDYVTGPYSEEEFWDDLLRVTHGETTECLARLTIRASADLAEWTQRHGVRWQRPLEGTLHLARTNLFMLGGGKAMINAYYATAHAMGVQVAYSAVVSTLKIRDGVFHWRSSTITAGLMRCARRLSSWPRAGSRRTSPG